MRVQKIIDPRKVQTKIEINLKKIVKITHTKKKKKLKNTRWQQLIKQ